METTRIKVPNMVSVGAHRLKIYIDPEQKSYGRSASVDYKLLAILIGDHTPESRKAVSLMHEGIHTISEVYLNGSLTEDQVEPLAEGLVQFLYSMGIRFDWEGIEVMPPRFQDLSEVKK